MIISTLKDVALASYVVIACASLAFGQSAESPDWSMELDAATLASPEVVETCQYRIDQHLERHPEEQEIPPGYLLEIKSTKQITVDSTEILAVLLGCGPGEIVFLDSLGNETAPPRRKFTTPSRHAAFGDYRDVNGDGIPELWIWLHSGSHGMYISFLSVTRDSTWFLEDDSGNNMLFASGGGIVVADSNSDGNYEVYLERMHWPGQEPPSPPTRVFKWEGNVFRRQAVAGNDDTK